VDDSRGGGLTMRLFNGVCLTVVALSVFGSGGLGPSVAQAQNGSVKTVFEKYGQLGTFASDCSKPPSKDNIYFVNRVIDDGHVQRDEMSGPTTRDHVTIIDRASPLGPSEISVSGLRDGQLIEGLWRIEPSRQIATEVTLAGKKVISGGRLLSTGRERPWNNRCEQR
jgi:hypothetical protein